ncbi:DNA translocase FtsK [Siculibacillus lacustris]|uniref:DNA translocase FtsK n=1 Tax=Siculibacillus lacustris TaxID=1549641 RepID=A0A4Q9VLD6_9HYPH|nr:DNA translocase FtsK [Siculibacillus lacustris]TBW36298.1 DNA translocase FtsK [Siculibacillus lacustris]
MRSARSASPAYSPEADVRQVLARNLRGFAGLATMAAVAAVGAALATWSATDPSLSNATTQPAHNALGSVGAILADLAMQVVGLSAPLLLPPLLVIGWRLIAAGAGGFDRRFATWWVLGGLATSGMLATLPLAGGWPLPIGLGGVIGDMLLRLPVKLLGDGDGVRVIAGLAFGGFAIHAFPRCLGWWGPRRIEADSAWDDDDFGGPDEDRGGFMPFAMLHHGFLVARANVLRIFGRRPNTLDARGHGPSLRRMLARFGRREEAWDDEEALPPSVGLRSRAPVGRVEPGFTPPRPESRPAPTRVAAPEPARTAPLQSELPFDDEDEDDWSPPPQAATAPRTAQVTRGAPVDAGADASDGRRIAVTPAAKPPLPGKPGARDVGMRDDHLDARGYQFPALSLLTEPKRLGPDKELSEDVLESNAGMLEGVLDDFGIKGEVNHVRPGPVVTLYELEPAPGVKSSRVIGLADDIARSMSAVSARVAVVPGRNVIGIELPNQRRETVFLRELLSSRDFDQTKARLAFCLGKTIGGESVIADLARMPHLLVAGTTGSGKSVAINTMIVSLLYRLTPQQCKLIMIDPKMLELSVYDNIPHLLTPVVTDPKKAVVALKWTVREMEDRYRKMSKLGVRNIDGFNARVAEANARGEVLTREVQTGFHRHTGEPIFEQEELALEPLPYIVVVVDEMADLMMVAGKEIEGAIQRLAQMARAAGIHIVMATQRPSVDVITGTIKANFPTRISFQVTSKIDSRTILGEQGAEQLLGQGDMLFMAGGGRIQRVHGPFISDEEVEKVVAHLKRQGAPAYLEAITAEEEEVAGDGDAGGLEDAADLYDKAVALVLRDKKASTSYIQRRLQIGYNRAASLIERMEKEGLVGAANHAGKRDILVGEAD